MTIEQLKKVTRCGICHKVGHWHRECPERSNNAPKETHHLETEEAIFCGHLEQSIPEDPAEPDVTAGPILNFSQDLTTSVKSPTGDLEPKPSASAAYMANFHDSLGLFEI